jgi:fumarate reductase flavoprotein subunit
MKDREWELSRRSFLRGAGVAGLAAAGMGLSACGAASEPAAGSGAGGGSGDAGAGSGGGSGASAADFAIAPVKLADAGSPAYECDYLVLGAGNCGMMSAAHASAEGLSVIVLEKADLTGGSSLGTEVTMAFSDCKIMQECQDDPNVINVSRPTGTPAEIYWYFMMHNSWEANAQLVMNYIHNNHRPHDFLYENGAYPMMLLPSLDAPTGGIMYVDQGVGVHRIMQETAEKNGAQILTSCPATALVVDETGAVTGAMAEQEGSPIFVKAKAVFVGTGGFSTNEKMVEHYVPGYGPLAWKNDLHLKHDGDGIRMMLGAGACESNMNLAQPAAVSVKDVPWEAPIDKAGREPYLWTNRAGKRLGNEKFVVMDTTFKVAIKENTFTYFNIFDSAAVKRMSTENFQTSPRTVLGSPAPEPDMAAALDEGVEEGLLYKGDSIAQLAKAAGIDPDELEKTVAAYNALVHAGEDTQFYKPVENLFSVEEGPFYAIELIPAWYSTLNGVRINGNIEVVDKDDRAIPGLYAGGLDSGEFYKDNYNHGFSGGCSGYSYFTGFFAVDKAKEYLATLA